MFTVEDTAPIDVILGTMFSEDNFLSILSKRRKVVISDSNAAAVFQQKRTSVMELLNNQHTKIHTHNEVRTDLRMPENRVAITLATEQTILLPPSLSCRTNSKLLKQYNVTIICQTSNWILSKHISFCQPEILWPGYSWKLACWSSPIWCELPRLVVWNGLFFTIGSSVQ